MLAAGTGDGTGMVWGSRLPMMEGASLFYFRVTDSVSAAANDGELGDCQSPRRDSILSSSFGFVQEVWNLQLS